MKKNFSLIASALMFTSFLFFSCQKNELSAPEPPPEKTEAKNAYNELKEKIETAHAFFDRAVDTTVQQSMKKRALWSQAYVGKAEGKEWVIVPLEYEHDFHFRSNFSGSETFELKQKSHLYVYKSADGTYKAEIFTYIPLEASRRQGDKNFSGMIAVTDWSDNLIDQFAYKNGERTTFSSLVSTGISTQSEYQTNSICVEWIAIHVYIPNAQGGLTHVVYNFCAKTVDERFEPIGEGGGPASDVYLSKGIEWTVQVQHDASWNVIYDVRALDIVNAVEPASGMPKYFTSLNPHVAYTAGTSGWWYTETFFDGGTSGGSTIVSQSAGDVSSPSTTISIAGSYTYYISSVFP